MKSSIYSKIDWFTFVCSGVSPYELYESLGLLPDQTYDVAEVFSNLVVVSRTYVPTIVLNVNGVVIEIKSNEIFNSIGSFDLEDLDPEVIFSTPFNNIRVDISGTGLDFLRSTGYDVDINFRSCFNNYFVNHPTFVWHVTRCDFAFDLINYAPNLIEDLRSVVIANAAESGRVPTMRSGGLSYQSFTGASNALYFGSVRALQLLRIYDKKFQFLRANKFASSCPYKEGDELPYSWIRIELQTRRDRAQDLLLNYQPEQIWHFIFEHFGICDKREGKGIICKVWRDLIDLSNIPPIIQNANLVKFVPTSERIINYVENIAFANIVSYISLFGFDWFKSYIIHQFNYLQKSTLDIDKRRLNSIMFKILCCTDNLTLPPHIVLDNGFYKFI